LSKYRKTIAAALAAILGWVGAVIVSKSGPVTAAEWYQGAVSLAGVFGVCVVSNDGFVPESDLRDGGTH
jgi:hypothetical protein